MDILAARKKAAEKKRDRDAKEAAIPAEPQQHEAPAHQPVPASAADATVVRNEEPSSPFPEAEEPQEPQSPEKSGDEKSAAEVEILAFRLGHEEYAVMVADVREVLRIRDLTMVPNAARHILGVASLRGTMLPVIDPCTRLGIEPGVRDEKSRIIVVSPDEEDVGLMVDRVIGVVKIPEDAVKPAPENPEHEADYLRGIVRKGENLYIVLDLVKVAGM